MAHVCVAHHSKQQCWIEDMFGGLTGSFSCAHMKITSSCLVMPFNVPRDLPMHKHHLFMEVPHLRCATCHHNFHFATTEAL